MFTKWTTNHKPKRNEGLWYFVDYKSQADKKIYFTDYKSNSDITIFFVDYKSQAWLAGQVKETFTLLKPFTN